MSISAVAPTPFTQDPDRLSLAPPPSQVADKAEDGADGPQQHLTMFAEETPSFWDVLDVINPLQHIPIVNDIYQQLTGDKIGVGARLMGGTLFGGPIGLIASALDCMVEESTGKDTGGHMLALFRDDKPAAPGDAPATQVAAAEAQPQQPAAQVNVGTPVIVPQSEGARPASNGRTMSFSLGDGEQPPPPPAPQAAVAVASSEPMALTAPAKVMPLNAQQGRFMPVPARTNVDPKAAPMVTVPVSTSQARSNVPITGRAPDAASAAAAQRALAAQSVPAGHPMLPPTDASGQNAASPDWFSAAWGEALDKYQRANRRNDVLTGTEAVN